jgi:hypothetical protein
VDGVAKREVPRRKIPATEALANGFMRFSKRGGTGRSEAFSGLWAVGWDSSCTKNG